MDQISTDCMTPTHMSPSIALGVVLIEEMKLSVHIEQSGRIVDPVLFWTEVKCGTIEGRIGGSLGRDSSSEFRQQKQSTKAGKGKNSHCRIHSLSEPIYGHVSSWFYSRLRIRGTDVATENVKQLTRKIRGWEHRMTPLLPTLGVGHQVRVNK